MKSVIVIPSRYGSTRFPGKPGALIRGKTLLERVWRIAKAVPEADEVIVATDDERIASLARTFGASVVMTSSSCENGTERVHEVVRSMKDPPEIVVNLQGDAVLTPPAIISRLIPSLEQDHECGIATPAVKLGAHEFDELRRTKQQREVSGTFVVFDKNSRALYFSKAPIPHVREGAQADIPAYRHIGLYAYRTDVLARLVALPPSPLEQVEKLEQLRALENGLPIRVVEVDYGGRSAWSVDTPEDVQIVETIIEREGELTPLS
jgi:3-deoxy-manno-octulosonate cytidylyltransferase (CMP-KDO synthetase)